MALIFNKDLGTSALLYSFNNNVVRFKSNTAGVTQTKATILTNGNTYTIYPDPAGNFYFNFKGIKSVELNVGNFAETINPDLAVSLVYNWTPKTILEETITFTVFLSNSTTETATRAVTWLNGFANLIDYKRNYPNLILDYSAFMLKPLPLIKYWPGLPFDIGFYVNPGANFTLINNSASIDWTFTNTNKVPRLFFSDGRLDISIEDYVPLNDGFNSMTLESGTNSINFLVEKINSYCNGTYLKWLNSFGGWSYWLFYKGNENLQTKELGVLNNDFSNLEDTVSPMISLGTESQNTIALLQEGITKDEMLLLRDLLDSAKVYMFTGIAFTQSSDKDWVEVIVKSGNFRLSNARERINNLSITIELPMNVNRKA
jgi:hypothetical protein